MHSTDYLLSEAVEKLRLVDLMKMECEKQKESNINSLNIIKSTIDKSIGYHIDLLNMRLNWLKAQADDVHKQQQECLTQKLKYLESSSIRLASCLNSIDCIDNESDLREILTNALNEADITDLPVSEGELTFIADNQPLKEEISYFGSVTTTKVGQGEKGEMADGFVMADMSNEIDNIRTDMSFLDKSMTKQADDAISDDMFMVDKLDNKIGHNIPDRMWLISERRPYLQQQTMPQQPKKEETSESPLVEKISDWLRSMEEKSSCSEPSLHGDGVKDNDDSSKVDSISQWLISPRSNSSSQVSTTSCETTTTRELSDFLYRPKKQPVEDSRDASSVTTKSGNKNSHKSFLRSRPENAENYKYPKRSFLDNCDSIWQQDVNKMIIKPTTATKKLPFEDEKCQWLFKKTDCSKSSCSSPKGCQMFEAKWLHTVSDW